MNEQDLANQFLGEEENAEPTEDDLTRLSKMLDNYSVVIETVERTEDQFKTAKKDLRQVEEIDIPTLMEELKFTKIQLQDGRTILIDEGFSASITVANRPEAAQWLIDHDLGEIIGYDLTISFTPDNKDDFERLRNSLEAEELYPKSAFVMHTGKIKAALKDLMGEGVEVPEKVFGIFKYKKAKVTYPK